MQVSPAPFPTAPALSSAMTRSTSCSTTLPAGADGSNLAYLGAYTLVTTIVPYVAYTTGLQQVENGVAAVLACIEPVMATVFGIFFFSEMPDLSGWLGIALVLAALTILNLQTKKETSEDNL